MSIAIAEVIVSAVDWTPLNLANSFMLVFKRDPHEGYAGRFYEFLKSVQDGQDFLNRIVPTSDKSGAAMRAGPIGVFPTIGEVIEKCRVQATVTHNTEDGINAALAAALMTHYFIYELGPKAELGTFLDVHVPCQHQWSEVWDRGKVKSKGWMSVRAAITAVIINDNLSDLLKDCINFSGDVDTVATIPLRLHRVALNMQTIYLNTLLHRSKTVHMDMIIWLIWTRS